MSHTWRAVQSDLGPDKRPKMQPSIMCAEVSPKKQKKSKQLLETVAEDGSCSFAKALGSVDFHTRERGVQALTVFLRNSQLLSPLAMRKLWKGLFYCFWHSDKAAAQVDYSRPFLSL